MSRSVQRISIPTNIIEDIEQERAYSAALWSGEFDSRNTVNDWAAYINNYLARATIMRGRHTDAGETREEHRARQRKSLVKAAGLVISALESFDDNGGFAERHYD